MLSATKVLDASAEAATVQSYLDGIVAQKCKVGTLLAAANMVPCIALGGRLKLRLRSLWLSVGGRSAIGLGAAPSVASDVAIAGI